MAFIVERYLPSFGQYTDRRQHLKIFSKEINNDNDLYLHLHDKIVMLASLLIMRLSA